MSKKPTPRKPNRTLLCCALAGCMLVAAPMALAHSTAATVRGQGLVDSAPATDASVTAINMAAGLTRTVRSSASGGYNIAGLPPGTYRIDVTANGQTSSLTVTVLQGRETGCDGLRLAAHWLVALECATGFVGPW